MYAIKKKKAKEEKSDFGTVITGPLGGDVPKADKVQSSPLKGVDVSAIAKLRAAKKSAPKVEMEVELGETGVEQSQKESPAREKYLERLKKRAK